MIKDLDGEKWKVIKGHEGTREVSNKGRVKHKVNGTEDWMLNKQKSDKNGYYRINNPTKHWGNLVHRIVAKAFIENSDNKKTVNHKNHVKKCNCVENLEWMTQKENNEEYEKYKEYKKYKKEHARRKESTTIEDLMTVIELFENAGITYLIGGGWGVDILAGQQTRERVHRNIDVNYDSLYTDELLNLLSESEYVVDLDWKPVIIELYSERYGCLNIHPFTLNEDGTAEQTDLEGKSYKIEKDFFAQAVFEGKTIPCISVKGQKILHSSYDLRNGDKHDKLILENIIE